MTSVIVKVSAVIPHGTAPGIIDFGEKNFGNASSFTIMPLLYRYGFGFAECDTQRGTSLDNG
ncbi:hypothetical protein nublan005_27830 [Klebsiella pneumoniae]